MAVPSMVPVDESYFERAPQRFSHTWSIARPAEAVWGELVGEQPLHWCRGLRIRWTSPPPFGVGTTRNARALGGLSTSHEYFFIWEEGRRHAFYFTSGNLPVFTSLAEDYLVEPDGDDRCRFTWRVGITPSSLGKPGAPLNRLLFAGFFRDTGRYFQAA
jgi:hypothetical protein